MPPDKHEPSAATVQKTNELQTWMASGSFAPILIPRTLIARMLICEESFC